LRDFEPGSRPRSRALSAVRGSIAPEALDLGELLALTQNQLADAVADRAGLTKAQAKTVLQALEDVVLEEIGNAEKVKIGNLVQLNVRVKPATKERPGRNPATGEEITISAKPASVDVRARVLAKTKSAVPSLATAQAKLG
jgi:DNA-binding protein HU-beta